MTSVVSEHFHGNNTNYWHAIATQSRGQVLVGFWVAERLSCFLMTPILLLMLTVLMALDVMKCEFTRSNQKMVVSVSTASYAGRNRNDSRSLHHLCHIAERLTEYDTQA